MTRWTWIPLSVALAVPTRLAAQQPPRDRGTAAPDAPRMTWSRAAAHYGKWLTAGAAIGFTVMAAHEHRHSARRWDALIALCRSADTACVLAPDGGYVRADAEALYRQSLHYDRRANTRLLAAQASLIVTAIMFIVDLSGRSGDPDNIPFAPLQVTAAPGEGRLQVGVRIDF